MALGRAIVRRPRVFLLDEPLSNLDAPMRAQMRAEIARLHRRLGATMIYVTHDQAEAMTLGQRLAVMREGAIQQAGEPMRIYAHPANRFVAGFIGSPPMNFFHGTLAGKGNGLSFQTDGGEPTFKLQASTFKVQLDGYAGKKVVLGLRPESIKTQNSETRGQAEPERIVDAVAEVVEPLGPETYLYLSSGPHQFISRVQPGDRISVGQKVSLVFDMRRAHFFDPATEQLIA
ncbi:MAG: hypothetical protein DME25_21350 [Verrucomicrobia bacterium]|nr:MAG: hypothetical protein DME25_21350 [Verrucomicrobiota bacterium]